MSFDSNLGLITAFGSSVTWATGAGVYSKLSTSRQAYSVNFSRALLALPLFLIASIIAGGGWSGFVTDVAAFTPGHLLWLTISMFSSYAVGDLLFFRATRSLGIPGALAIASSYPLWTALASMALGEEPLSPLRLAGLIVTLGGVITVILNGPKSERKNESRPPIWEGIIVAFLASIFWAMNSYAVSRGGQNVSAWVANAFRMVLGLVLTAGISQLPLQAFGLTPRQPLVLPAADLKKWGWAFVVEAFGGSYLFLYGLSHSPLSVGPILSSLAPVISVPVAVALRFEKFSFLRTLGVCLAVLGLAILVSN